MEAMDVDDTLEHTPTWAVGLVCVILVIASLLLECGLKTIDEYFKRTRQKELHETLQKMKEELMLLGFISFMLVVTRDSLAKICIPDILSQYMLPCSASPTNAVESVPAVQCKAGKVPLMSPETLQQLHMFIFVMAMVHVLYCCITMVLARLQVKGWGQWESERLQHEAVDDTRQASFLMDHTDFHPCGPPGCFLWIDSFFRQFCNPVKKSDYLILRFGFVKNHGADPTFNFLEYIMRTMEDDFKTIVGIRAHLWVFVIIFLLLNIHGWYTYFWIAFFPFIILLIIGTKLQHVITSIARETQKENDKSTPESIKPRDNLFWFSTPQFLLHLIHFILFQNSFELAYFFWIWSSYGLNSCFMVKRGLVYTRVALGFLSQILCSYATLPLYALTTQMGSSAKKYLLAPPGPNCQCACRPEHHNHDDSENLNLGASFFASNKHVGLVPKQSNDISKLFSSNNDSRKEAEAKASFSHFSDLLATKPKSETFKNILQADGLVASMDLSSEFYAVDLGSPHCRKQGGPTGKLSRVNAWN